RIACSQNVTMQISLTTSSLMTKKIVLCGNFDERWPGGSAASNLASAADGRVDFRSTLRTQLSLGHGSRDRELIDIVELERFSRVAPNSASQHQHGDAIEISFGNAREGVRQPGSRNEVYGGKLTGCTRDSIGHERCALFV